MNDLFKAIGREWERNLLMTIAAVIACVGGFCAYQYLNHEEETASDSKKKPELPFYYAVSLLDGTTVPAMQDGVNPMSCEFKKPEPPSPPPKPPWKLPTPPKPKPEPVKPEPVKPEPVKPEPVKPTPVKPEPVKPTPVKPEPVKPEPVKPTPQPVKPEPEKPTPPKPKPTPPKPVPPKPPRVVELRYIGNMSIDGGDSAAQLYVSEVISKKQKNTFKARLRVGEKILGGLLEIKAFDKNRVVLVHSGNKEVKVPIRQKKPMVVSIPQ